MMASFFVFLKIFAFFGMVFFVASLIIFGAVALLPGDPAAILLGIQADEVTRLRLREALALDRPAFLRYLDWIFGFFTGDWGQSLIYGRPVFDIIQERLPVTLTLAGMAMIFTLFLSIIPGVISALCHNRWPDHFLMLASQIFLAIPGFWLGIILIMIFSLWLGWFPAGGVVQNDFPNLLKSLFLPALSLALPQWAILLRMVRFSMLTIIRRFFITVARAKGLTHREAVFRHGLRNAFAPIMTLMAMQFSFMITGAIIIETVFYLPGLGRLVFQAVMQRDWTVLQMLLLVFVFMTLFVHLLAESVQNHLDPRYEMAGRGD